MPYLMSSHPGCRMADAIELALFLKQNKMRPEQVQDFYPTPGTISTCMYYTELDPYTMERVFVPKTPSQKAEQRALLQYFKPENKAIVFKALKDCGRTDLIGSGPNCLINAPGYGNKQPNNSGRSRKKVNPKSPKHLRQKEDGMEKDKRRCLFRYINFTNIRKRDVGANCVRPRAFKERPYELESEY